MKYLLYGSTATTWLQPHQPRTTLMFFFKKKKNAKHDSSFFFFWFSSGRGVKGKGRERLAGFACNCVVILGRASQAKASHLSLSHSLSFHAKAKQAGRLLLLPPAFRQLLNRTRRRTHRAQFTAEISTPYPMGISHPLSDDFDASPVLSPPPPPSSCCPPAHDDHYLEHQVSRMDTLPGLAIKYGVEARFPFSFFLRSSLLFPFYFSLPSNYLPTAAGLKTCHLATTSLME